MHRVFLNKHYTMEARGNMQDWCKENCIGAFSAGIAPYEGYFGEQLAYESALEAPWYFTEAHDAALFKLRWAE